MTTTEEYQQAGEALLATVRQVMTGREIDACEWTQSAEFPEEFDAFHSRDDDDWEPEEEEYSDPEAFQEAHDAWEQEHSLAAKEDAKWSESIKVLHSLAIQFSREIANHIDEKNRSVSRLAIETHNRLHPTAA